MCAVDYADPWTMFHTETRTARKPHRCGDCGRAIKPGETYHYGAGKESGYNEWSVVRMCRHCYAAADWLLVMCNGWVYGQVYDELVEHWHEGYASRPLGEAIARLKRGWNNGADPVPTGMGDDARRQLEQETTDVRR